MTIFINLFVLEGKEKFNNHFLLSTQTMFKIPPKPPTYCKPANNNSQPTNNQSSANNTSFIGSSQPFIPNNDPPSNKPSFFNQNGQPLLQSIPPFFKANDAANTPNNAQPQLPKQTFFNSNTAPISLGQLVAAASNKASPANASPAISSTNNPFHIGPSESSQKAASMFQPSQKPTTGLFGPISTQSSQLSGGLFGNLSNIGSSLSINPGNSTKINPVELFTNKSTNSQTGSIFKDLFSPPEANTSTKSTKNNTAQNKPKYYPAQNKFTKDKNCFVACISAQKQYLSEKTKEMLRMEYYNPQLANSYDNNNSSLFQMPTNNLFGLPAPGDNIFGLPTAATTNNLFTNNVPTNAPLGSYFQNEQPYLGTDQSFFTSQNGNMSDPYIAYEGSYLPVTDEQNYATNNEFFSDMQYSDYQQGYSVYVPNDEYALAISEENFRQLFQGDIAYQQSQTLQEFWPTDDIMGQQEDNEYMTPDQYERELLEEQKFYNEILNSVIDPNDESGDLSQYYTIRKLMEQVLSCDELPVEHLESGQWLSDKENDPISAYQNQLRYVDGYMQEDYLKMKRMAFREMSDRQEPSKILYPHEDQERKQRYMRRFETQPIIYIPVERRFQDYNPEIESSFPVRYGWINSYRQT